MEYIIVPALLGLIPGFIATNKGRSFVLWWFYGAMLFIVALPHALIMQSRSDGAGSVSPAQASTLRPCPYCAELIQQEAVFCRFCQRDVEPALSS
jgi:hypothetical protein